MRKRFCSLIALLLSALMVCSVVTTGAVSVGAAEVGMEEHVGVLSGTTGDCTWMLDDGVLTISGSGEMGDYSNYPAESRTPWFGKDIKSVVIEDGVKNIGNYAFAFSERLTNIEIPVSVTQIGNDALRGCTALTKISIPDSVISIDEWAFASTGLKSVTLPNRLSVVSTRLFSNCAELTKVDIPDSVKRIGDWVFYFCVNLTTVTFSNNVKNIGDGVFSNCPKLTSFTIPEKVTRLGESVFACTGIKSIIIPDNVKTIGVYSFASGENFSSVTIGNSVTSIGEYAFKGCTDLKSVTIPDSVTSIGNEAFGYIYGEDGDLEKIDGFTIYGYEGSEAYKYAKINGFKFVKLVSKSDESTGITLDNPEDMTFTVTQRTGQDVADINKTLPEGLSAKAVYDITVTKNGSAVQPENIVKVMIPCDNKNARVFRKEADGTLTDMKAVYKDGNLIFYTDHFSIYVVAEEKSLLIGDVNGDGAVNSADRIYLTRYLSKWDGFASIDEKSADVNADGKVNAKDRIILSRHIAKWQGYETLPYKG